MKAKQVTKYKRFIYIQNSGTFFFFLAICEPVTYFLKSYIWLLIYAEGGEIVADHERF